MIERKILKADAVPTIRNVLNSAAKKDETSAMASEKRSTGTLFQEGK